MNRTWQRVKLGDVLSRSDERVEIRPDRIYKQITVRLWGQGVVLRNEVPGVIIRAKTRYVARKGQFILSRIDARNGAFGLVPSFLDGAVVSNDFPVFNIDETKLLPRFLEWMSKTRDFVALCRRTSEGTTNRVRLQLDRFSATGILLPPLAEQRRIIARIEELAAKIEAARALRQQAAAETHAMLESAKRACIGDPRTNPLGWPAFRLGQISEMRYGISAAISKAIDPRIGFPIIRMANIGLDGSLDLSDLRYYALNDSEKTEFLLQPEDLLLNWRSGSEKHVGKTALFSEQGEYTFASFLLRVRAKTDIVSPAYLKLILNFMRSEGVFLRAQRFQVNTKLNAKEFANFDIMVPSLREQRRIVAYLDELQARVAAVQALQAATAAQLEALLPSLLDKAFKGEL